MRDTAAMLPSDDKCPRCKRIGWTVTVHVAAGEWEYACLACDYGWWAFGAPLNRQSAESATA